MIDFKAGDLMAFNLLYARHKGPSYRYMLKQCSDQSMADDLMQELWGKLINAKDNYEPTAKFTTWLYTIAHHVIVDHHRRFARQQAPLEQDRDIELIEIDTVHSPEQQTESRQQKKTIDYCLKKLPTIQLETFLLKQETDLNLEQIATIIDCSLEAAKSRLRYAYQSLRKCLSLNNMTGEQ
ncbi:sigma-70 family RNA polymerase sigma factor [Psychrobium sp. nBUS_13]|uniref:sigma-70 family RNA polymerase sigma factor n=1 Tax=Psychrobium sp. nBUS_13 TaxID=3395319 RepID=UPI003EBBD2A1